MKKILFALLALSACSQQPGETAHDEHAAMAGMETAHQMDGAAATLGDLSITSAWAASTPGGAEVAAGYLTIANAGDVDDRLIGVSSPRAGRAETHEMAMDGDMMTMRKVDAILVPAHGEARLSPGALHLMLFDITAPFVEGESVPVTLHFERAGEVSLDLPVKARPTH